MQIILTDHSNGRHSLDSDSASHFVATLMNRANHTCCKRGREEDAMDSNVEQVLLTSTHKKEIHCIVTFASKSMDPGSIPPPIHVNGRLVRIPSLRHFCGGGGSSGAVSNDHHRSDIVDTMNSMNVCTMAPSIIYPVYY